jgi:uncharacterized membrane protein
MTTPDLAKGQPLYIPPAERVSLEDLKQRVGQIQDKALVDSKAIVNEVYEQNVTRAVLVALGVVVVAASIAYYFGTQASRKVTITNAPPV